jgi:antitoxin component YwqK of YwqJK toxin-antitoxin module
MKKISILLSIILFGTIGNELHGCTVFKSTNKKITYVGSNEDYKRSNSQIFFIPAKNGKYGHVLFGYNGSVQSGINEKGLFWDGLRAYPYVKVENASNKPDIGGNVLYKILEECASVDEVIKLFETFYWDGFKVAQLMIVDKTGESAIITYKENKLTITRTKNLFQVCTNFRISSEHDTKNYHWYNIGSKRFKKATQLLENQELKADDCISILKATHQNNIFSKTIYSSVFNLNTGDIHISINGDFSKIMKINLFEELENGKHSYLLYDLVNLTNKDRNSIKVLDERFLTKGTCRILLDQDWQITTKENKAKFYRTIEEDPESDHYIKKDYFMSGTLQGIAYYSSLNPEIIDGEYYEYYEDGKLKAQGFFKHRLKNGDWKYWSSEGEIEKTIKYEDGIKE